jgi:hypothetical protein
MSHTSNFSETIDTCLPPQSDATPSPVNAFPLLGLALVLLSAAISCGLGYYFLVG